ncbi:MAG: MqnA/MqnD/SBP family protein [Candidatus Thalassarchaeaceae archaeon]
MNQNAFQLNHNAMSVNEDTVTVRIGHSPDPDDAFMFHALTNGSIDTGNRRYEHVLVDIDTLNSEAEIGSFEVSAVSIHSYPKISDSYFLMNCGASMGEGYGPILVSKGEMSVEEAKNKVIAVPGKSTSSYLALVLALGDVEVREVPFDEILPGVLDGKYDSGVIIHEGQLTWSDEGAYMVLDLGIWWNEKTGLPLPLGGNIVRKDLGESVCREICEDIRRSIEYSLDNPDAALKDAIKWGRGIDEDTNEEFVKMYVNRRTIDYGEDGRSAVRMFLERGIEVGLVRSDFDTSGLKFIGEGEND